MTSKGQITLPSEVRRRLGLVPGQRLAVRARADRIEISAPEAIDTIRAEIKREAQAAGTWGKTYANSDGWAEAAADRLGASGA
jgi:AbrB family looped-hinge helix DNA binding protein